MNLGSIEAKFAGFGWNAVRVDGHDVAAIYAALNMAKEIKGKPTAIILSTIKGKGVKAMENEADWHGKAPKEKEAREAIADLGFEWGELGGVK
jgi:transketolase